MQSRLSPKTGHKNESKSVAHLKNLRHIKRVEEYRGW